jgi:aspartyl-tRNA(Asn)/glutamyl-tRNA(Gln) amidotransferase subunit C
MITKETTEKIAKLARLEFTPQEHEQLAGELNNILGYIDQLNELDVENVTPLENINEAVENNTFRSDQIKASLTQAEALKNAPKSGDGFFLVPKVIEQTASVAVVSSDDDEDNYE